MRKSQKLCFGLEESILEKMPKGTMKKSSEIMTKLIMSLRKIGRRLQLVNSDIPIAILYYIIIFDRNTLLYL